MVWRTLIVLAFGALGGFEMRDQNNASEDLDRIAARVALLTLRGNAGQPDSNWRFVMAVGNEPVPLDSAVGLLAAVPKPAKCRGRLSDKRTVTVTCETLRDGRTRSKHATWARRWTSDLEKVIHEDCEGVLANPQIEVVVGGEESVFPFRAVQRWLRDYFMSYQIDIESIRRTEPKTSCMIRVTIRPGGEFLITPDSEPPH